MAGSIKGITIEIGGETTGLQKALKGVNSQSIELQKELKQVDNLLKFNPGNAELVSQKQKLLADQVATTTDKLKKLKDAQSQVDAQFASGKINGEQYRAFNRELAATEGSLNGLKNKFAGLQAEQGRIESSTRQLNTLFDATGTSVDQYANALGSGLVNAIKNGTASSKQLDDAISKIGQAALGSSTDIDKMKKALSSVDDGASLNSVKKDLSEVAKEADQAGDKVNGFGDDLKGVVAGLAAGGGIAGAISAALDTSSLNTDIDIAFNVPEESKQTVKDAIRTVTSYGVDGEAALEGVRRQWALNKDATDESNAAVVTMAGTITKSFSGIDFTELIQEANEIGATLGITNEEALGLVNTLLDAGFPPEQLDIIAEYGDQMIQAGFSAKEVQSIMLAGVDTKSWNIDNLLDGVKEGRVQMADFGSGLSKELQGIISQTDISADQFVGWGQAIAEGGEGGQKAMLEATKALAGVEDSTTRNALGTKMFGTMWEDQGMKIVDTIINAEGKTVDLGKGIDDVNQKTEKLDSDPTVTMRQAFTALKDSLQPILTVIAEVIAKIAEWVQNNPTLAATIAAVVSGIGILMGIIIALAPVFTAIATAAGALGVSIGAISLPIVAIIAAIGLLIAAGVAIYKNWDEISAFASEIWSSITNTISNLLTEGRTKIVSIWSSVTDFFRDWGPLILSILSGPVGMLVTLIVKNFSSIKAQTLSIWNIISSFLSKLWSSLTSTASNTFTSLKSNVFSIFSSLKSSLTNLWNQLVSFLKSLWSGLKSTASTIFSSLKSNVVSIFTNLKSNVTSVFTSLKSILTNLWSGLKSTASSIFSSLKSNVVSIFTSLHSSASSIFSSMKNAVVSATNSTKSALLAGWNSAKSIVTNTVNSIKTVVSNIFNSLKSVVSSAMGKVKSAIETGWNTAKSFLDGISLTSVGKNIVSGLVSGISSMFGKVKSKISELASLIPAWAKDILDIHSPSRVMKAIGVHVGDGLAEGIDSSKSAVAKSAVNLAKAAVPDFSSKIAITQSELKKLNSVITSVTNTAEKEISKIQSNAQKERALILKQANKSISDLVKKDKEEIKKINKNEEDKINEIIAKAKDKKRKLTAAEERKIISIHEDAKEARAKVAQNEEQKIKTIQEKSANDRAKIATSSKKEITEIEKGLNAGKLKALEEYVDKRKGLESMTTEQEVEFWKEAVKKFKKGTEEKTQAQIKYNKALDTLNKEQFDKEKDYIEDKKYYNKLSLSEELAAYQQYLKEHKKGSEERIYYEKEIYRVKQEIQKQIDQINEDYLSKVQTLNQQLIDEENKLNDEYKKALDDRAKSLYSFAGIFDEIAAKDVSGDTLLNNLQSQVTAFEDWQRNISELASKGINEGLLAELQEMGPKAGAEIAALNTLTDEQLQQYVALWQEKNRLAKEQATKELEGMKIETGIKIEELKKDTATKLLGYQEEWRKAMVNAKLQVKNEAKEMPGIGEFAVAGLIDGLNSKKSALVSAAQELASIVKDTFQMALDIHSPSRVFKGFGVNINEGLIQGIQESSRQLDRAMNDVYGSMASSAGKMLQTSGNTQRTNSYDHSKTMHNTFQINTVDSTDIVRKIERAQRRMAFEFGV
ncbi:hypothetical protein ACIQXU_16450 [Peribacillus sp. NPDC097284]|uniref:hypothetical protein n=1 Tax=Peribacillus sp. NPDC097284 TaxID=3364401 RepID=UPI0037F7FA70